MTCRKIENNPSTKKYYDLYVKQLHKLNTV